MVTEFLGSYAGGIIAIILGLTFLAMMVVAPCHAVFLLPFAGLPLFWLVPLEYALPINIMAWLATPFLYRVIRRAMMKPVQDGFRSLVGTRTEVVSRTEADNPAGYLVRAQGELWSACSTDALEIGEPVNIVAVKGIGVIVERAGNGSHPGEAIKTENSPSGGGNKRGAVPLR